MPAKVLTIAQQKGGTGKTTVAAQLAVAWAGRGRRVALVDLDTQQSLTAWYWLRRELYGLVRELAPPPEPGAGAAGPNAEEARLLAELGYAEAPTDAASKPPDFAADSSWKLPRREP